MFINLQSRHQKALKALAADHQANPGAFLALGQLPPGVGRKTLNELSALNWVELALGRAGLLCRVTDEGRSAHSNWDFARKKQKSPEICDETDES